MNQVSASSAGQNGEPVAGRTPARSVGIATFIQQTVFICGPVSQAWGWHPEQNGTLLYRLGSDCRVENGLRVSWGLLTLFAMVITR